MGEDAQKLIQTLEQFNKQLQERVREQDETIRELRAMIANLQETLEEFKRKLFGSSSEKLKEEADTGCRETETILSGEEKQVSVKGHTRTRKPKSIRKELYEALPVRKVECSVPDEDRLCPDCGASMERLGAKYVREELRIIPAKVERIQYYQETVVCPVCREEDEATILAARTPTPLLSHSPASASMVARVMYDKSCLYLPFYRQEKDWRQKGVPLPRETAANWYNRCALEYLAPVYEALHAELLKREVLHVDEVPGQVLHEPERKAESKSYFWIYMSGTDGNPGIVLYDYQPGRSGDYPVAFLAGYVGIIHCDGYSAYGRLEDVTLVCCLAHCRRKFYEAVPKERRKGLKLLDIHSEQELVEPGEDIADRDDLLPAEKGVLFCNRLFFLERQYRDLPPEERKARREATEPGIWKEFWEWLQTLEPLGGSKLEKAVNYAQNHKEGLMNYLLDGRCEISNNAAERRAKAYATSRKNFLFHDTVDGAKASAIVMSLIETAKANNLNIYQYLYTLLLFMPDQKESSAGIEQLMPWSTFIQERCSGLIDTETYTPENPGKLPI